MLNNNRKTPGMEGFKKYYAVHSDSTLAKMLKLADSLKKEIDSRGSLGNYSGKIIHIMDL